MERIEKNRGRKKKGNSIFSYSIIYIGQSGINWEQIKQVGNWDGYQLKRKLGLGFNECENDKRVGKSGVGVIGKIE